MIRRVVGQQLQCLRLRIPPSFASNSSCNQSEGMVAAVARDAHAADAGCRPDFRGDLSVVVNRHRQTRVSRSNILVPHKSSRLKKKQIRNESVHCIICLDY